MHEKREFTRIDGTLEVDLIVDSSRRSARLRNMSMNGALLTSPDPIQVGSAIELIVCIDRIAGVEVNARGRVVRSTVETQEIAIEFTELIGLESYESLRNWITYNAPEGTNVEAEFVSHVGIRKMGSSLPPGA